MGDPIELVALRAAGWDYDATAAIGSAADRTAERDAALKAAEATLATMKKSEGRAGGPSPQEIERAAKAVTEASAAKERAVKRRAEAPHKSVRVKPLQRHHFSSALQRMSVVAHVQGMRAGDGRAEEAVGSYPNPNQNQNQNQTPGPNTNRKPNTNPNPNPTLTLTLTLPLP